MCITVLRVLHHALCLYFDLQMERDSVALEIVWTHVTGGTKKKTQRFATMDDDLLGIAGSRDDEGGDLVIMEEMDEGPSGGDGYSDYGSEYDEEDHDDDYREEDAGSSFYNSSNDKTILPSRRQMYAGIRTVQDNTVSNDDEDDLEEVHEMGFQSSDPNHQHTHSSGSNDGTITPVGSQVSLDSLPSESDVSL